MARSLEPDVIVMDLTLPGIDGYEAMRRIGSFSRHTRLLVLTSHAPERSLVKSMEAGAFGFVRKANAHSDLLPAMRSVLRGEVFLDSGSHQVLVRYLERTLAARRRLAALTPAGMRYLAAHRGRSHRAGGGSRVVSLAPHRRQLPLPGHAEAGPGAPLRARPLRAGVGVDRRRVNPITTGLAVKTWGSQRASCPARYASTPRTDALRLGCRSHRLWPRPPCATLRLPGQTDRPTLQHDPTSPGTPPPAGVRPGHGSVREHGAGCIQ
jgi:CheY-like chemotaxis protein